MNFNLNSGYGAALASALHRNVPVSGKLFIVGDSGTARLDMIKQVFVPDTEGEVRFFSTIAAALTECTANAGDVILVAPGHSETLTAALTLNVAGVSVIGLGNGTLRPALTGNGTIDCVNITADDVTFDGFHFPAPETDDQTASINIAGVDGVTVKNISGIGSKTAKNVVDMITVAAGSDRLTIENIELYNATVAVNSFLSFEGACTTVKVKNFRAYGLVETGGIIDGALVSNLSLEDVLVHVTGTTKPAITLDSNPTGTALRVYAKGTSTTLATNCNLGNALALFEIRTAEDFSVQGAIIPAADTE